MATKPKKPRDGSRARHGKGILRGDAFLPGVDTDILRKIQRCPAARTWARRPTSLRRP